MEWLAFFLFAAVAAFSGTIAVNTFSADLRWYGTMICIFSALAAIMVPVLLTLNRKTAPSKP